MALTQPFGLHRRLGGVRVHRSVSIVLLVALTVGCAGGGQASEPPPSQGPVEGSWVLTAGTLDGAQVPIPEDHRITLTVEGTQIGGTAACNSYGGRVVPGPGGMRIEHLSQTDMACEEPAMAAEAIYLTALTRVRQLVRDGEELIGRGDGVELRFDMLRPPPTAELVDTVWVLDTVIVGDVAAAPTGEPATLELRSDGTFSGSTGCRSFSGEWLEAGDQILAPSWGMDEIVCSRELTGQDTHVVAVIGDGFIPSVDGNLLTLMDPGGTGLVYRAGD